nr:MAG TPA: ThiS-like ubiquitin [Caudoviricetes sp.]
MSSHTLTNFDSNLTVTVNGNVVTSPYALVNGDVIELTRPTGYKSVAIITDTGSYDTDTTSSPLAVHNSDIRLQAGSIERSPSIAQGYTINYTA